MNFAKRTLVVIQLDVLYQLNFLYRRHHDISKGYFTNLIYQNFRINMGTAIDDYHSNRRSTIANVTDDSPQRRKIRKQRNQKELIDKSLVLLGFTSWKDLGNII